MTTTLRGVRHKPTASPRYTPGRRHRREFSNRPHVRGKFLYVGKEKLYLKGVTYGPFKPDSDGGEYKTAEEVELDFLAMNAAGINTVRTYTAVPRWLLDCAERNHIRVLIGIAWPQHVAFLDTSASRKSIIRSVREAVRQCAGHPAVLGYAVGNEIPSTIVRWYGAGKIEQFIRSLYEAAKAEDPEALVTYVNYPTTEYLRLGFVDFLCYNVYLEDPKALTAYIGRLQNIADDKPLVLGELGLDSARNGRDTQASTLRWQVGATFAGGCAGVCVFSWTDEWFRGGADIADWDFGLTDRERKPKPALGSVASAFAAVPFPEDAEWPRISVVVCTYNGARHIREACEALERLEYPNHEVIVVCDGSTDETLTILEEFDFKVVNVANGGLSQARNLGLAMATGEIIAYLDDDAYPDSHWLQYLAWTFMTTRHAGVGGPNLAPTDDAFWATCVSHSPGGPNHVLLSDDIAEHIPGCNMAFRKSALEKIGGFDRKFRIAGDDVDVCWRIQEDGGTLGFSPGAVVWHHRRNSMPGYLRQQLNYGRAEAMLAMKWPSKFNSAGHVRWGGRLYGTGRSRPAFGSRVAIYQGTWGTAPFQAMYEQPHGIWSSLPLLPEWWLFLGGLGAVSLLGFVEPVFFTALILLLPALATTIIQSLRGASAARLEAHALTKPERIRARVSIALLHFVQPVVRLRGRMMNGLSPWRRYALPVAVWGFRPLAYWREEWKPHESRLVALERALKSLGAGTARGGDFDSWDLEIFGGIAGSARVLMVLEDHANGCQFVRCRLIPVYSAFSRGLLGCIGIAMLALFSFGSPLGALTMALGGVVVSAMAMSQAMHGASLVVTSIERSFEPG